MKTRLQIARGEKIEHKGDLTIEQDIAEDAELKIINGSLIVNGNIGHGVKIELIAPERKNDMSHIFSSGGISLSNVSFSGGVHIFTSRGGYTNSVRADTMINNSYIGHVNIDNRILTEADLVTKLSNDSYRITPPQFGPKKAFARATIDGMEYKGAEILVKGKEVLVDGKKPGAPITSSESAPELPTEPAKMLIRGTIGNNVTLISGAESTVVEKNIGSECKITCSQGGFEGNDVGRGTHITADNKLTLSNVDDDCTLASTSGELVAQKIGRNGTINVSKDAEIKESIGAYTNLTSEYGSLTTPRIDNNVTVTVSKEIDARMVGDDSTLTSNYGGLKSSALGQNVTVEVSQNMFVELIGKSSNLKSNYGALKAGTAEEKAVISVNKSAFLYEVHDRCKITSDHSSITVLRTAGNHTRLRANHGILVKQLGNDNSLTSDYAEITIEDTAGVNNNISANKDINVHSSLGNNCTLTSDYGNVVTQGLSGNGVTIKASRNINVGHIGSHAHLTSDYGTVTTGNLGSHSNVNANRDVTINGCCPRTARVHSDYGRVYKNGSIQEYQHVDAPEEDAELVMAIAQSLSLQDQKPAMDTKPIPTLTKKPVPENRNDISVFDLSKFTPYTKSYVEGFAHKTKNSFKIKALSLTAEEEEKLSKGLVDEITEYVPEIPVHLNERLYDLSTVINLFKEGGIDPYTRFPFTLEHVVAAHPVQEKLDKRIKKIEENAKMKASTSVLISKTGPQLYSQKENDVAATSQKENNITARKRLN